MAKDEIGGVWRTVGGRRIFIKEGQSLSDAMKKSGKFKDGKKKMSDEELKKEIGNDVKKLHKYADEEGILPSELQDRLGIKDSDLGLKDEYTEKFEKEMQGMQRELKAEEAKRSTSSTNSKFKNAPADIQRNVSDFEKAGIKVSDAFETNLYGNGKADRFMLSDGSYIEHTSEAFGKKTDTWSLDRDYDKSGNYNPQSKKFSSYEELINYLKKNK